MKTYREYTDPQGNKYTQLPSVWNNMSPFRERVAFANGWTYEDIEIPDLNSTPIDDTQFKKACQQFVLVCKQIGQFIGDQNFKGGFDQYDKFINSTASMLNPSKASLLASMWSGTNEYCKYEGQKIGLKQPDWWYQCWRYEAIKQRESSSSSDQN